MVPFTVTGTDARGQLRMARMLPLTPNGRFHKVMSRATHAMATVGFSHGKIGTCGATLKRAPLVREIVAAATAKISCHARRATRR